MDVNTGSATALFSRRHGNHIMSTTTEKSYNGLLNKVSCPSCGNTRVRRIDGTPELIFVRCQECGHSFPIPERRRGRSKAVAAEQFDIDPL